jgi:hypothetical protein
MGPLEVSGFSKKDTCASAWGRKAKKRKNRMERE